MKAISRYCLVIAFLIQLPAGPVFADTHKFAVVIGNNQGHDSKATLRYAEHDARKLYQVLIDLGGISPDHATLLLGADSTEAWKAIRQTERRLVELKQKTGERAVLVIFYSGHAEGEVLELGESTLRFDGLLSFLRSSSADVRLAFLDSCQSGKLIAVRGGRRGPEYEISVTDEITSKGYAIVTSSAQNELSQESSELRGAYFTHYLVSALRGAGDKSGDGKVTLDEAYQYVYSNTLARTSATVGGSQHPMYEFELQGRGEIVLTRTDRLGSRIVVQLSKPGRLILLDEASDTIVAETEMTADNTAIFAVRPGSYRAYLLASDNSVRMAQSSVVAGQRGELSNEDFQTAHLETAVAKGGLFSTPETGWTHRISIGGLWRYWPLWGATSCYGATALYRIQSPIGWEPVAKFTWTTRSNVGMSTGYNDIGLQIGLGYALPFSHLTTRVELLAGYEHLFQDKWEGRTRYTSGFDYLGIVGIELPSNELFVGLDLGAGGRVFQIIGKGWVHRVDVQAILNLGWKLGDGN